MTLQKTACCKVNLLLNTLGKRADGFHELETVLQPIPLCDKLTFDRRGAGISLTCDQKDLATDQTNLVWRAAEKFFETAKLDAGAHIHLEKRIPMAAGLGGGSSDAAATLEGLNELFNQALGPNELHQLAAALGSDVPFFLQPCPALATGRGERVVSLEPFAALSGAAVLLVYPGFGIPTVWAYQQMARFPEVAQGRPGRAQQLIQRLHTGDLAGAAGEFYNALEAPALEKYPLLQIIREFLKEKGATVSMMSGSGSTVFGIFPNLQAAELGKRAAMERFGGSWCAAVAL